MKIGWRTDNPPEEKEEYLVYYTHGGYDVAKWTNANPFWARGTTSWHWICAQHCKVAAWMPLPEPFNMEDSNA